MFDFLCSVLPIHAEAPEFTDMSVEQEVLETGIKVVDLLAPYSKGGKIGRFNKWVPYTLPLLFTQKTKTPQRFAVLLTNLLFAYFLNCSLATRNLNVLTFSGVLQDFRLAK